MIKQTTTMKESVIQLADFMDTYSDQSNYTDYRVETYLNDVLYGLAVSINPRKYKFTHGFDQFKKDLVEFLND